MRYPRRLLTDDETVIREFHPHWRVLLLPLSWTAVLIAAPIVAWQLQGDRRVIGPTVAVISGLLWLVVALPPLIRWWFTQYVLTTERIIVRTGMVARAGTEIPLENINNVLFNQSVVERLLGFGDVLIESAGSQGQSRLRDIPDPEAFQSEVYRAREVRALQLSGSSGTRDPLAQIEALAALRDRGVLSTEEFEDAKRRLLGQLGTE